MAIIGGTGKLGPGLALRLSRAGIPVVIGSRDAAKAEATAGSIEAGVASAGGGASVTGASNQHAARDAGLAVVTLPFAALRTTLPELAADLAGKTVVSTVVPLEFVQGRPSLASPEEGSAAQQVAALLPGSDVTAALHTVSSSELVDPAHPLGADSLVTGDDPDALAATTTLVGCIGGLRPILAGDLAVSRYTEAVTVVMLLINKRHRGVHAGIRITGLP